jgi:rhamnogalacturonyl hydrolase YesR
MWSPIAPLLVGALLLFGHGPVHADDARNAAVEQAVREFVQPGQIALPIGVTPKGTYIWCVARPDAFSMSDDESRSVVAAAVDGTPTTVDALQIYAREFLADRQPDVRPSDVKERHLKVALIPIANPDAWYECKSEGAAPRLPPFPPRKSAYNSPEELESAVLCRFVEWFAADAVIEITPMDDPDLKASKTAGQRIWETDRLAGNSAGWDLAGRIQAKSFRLPEAMFPFNPEQWSEPSLLMSYSNLGSDLAWGSKTGHGKRSPSRTGQNARLRARRSPADVAAKLLDHYGHKLDSVMYQPALAVVARLEFSELTSDATHREAVQTILEPYLSGEKASLDDKSGGSHFAGQLVFAAWAQATGDQRAVALVKAAADRAFDEQGRPREAMPTHSEMSDAVFMACPILSEAGRLARDPKYFDMAARHLAFMEKLCRRDDGLYRHSPLCEAPWGRGNGFPALGLALSLTALQPFLNEPHADNNMDDALREAAVEAHAQMLASYCSHMQALVRHQDPTGTWRQVIDYPGAYRELTATCMITVAIARGLRMGWLDAETYLPVVDRAWQAINLRVYDDGVLFDVCTGTGKQKSLQDYLNREAILARDERGGAMALLAAIEMHRLLSERTPNPAP